MIFTLAHVTSIQIGLWLVSYKAEVVPWTEASLGCSADFHRSTVANQLRFRAKGLFVSDYDVWEKIAAFWHGF